MENRNTKISNFFKSYIYKLIPQSQTNIFYILFNGIEEAFNYLDYKINQFKKENNLLTAQEPHSLRHLAALNGFEPKLKTPAKGFIEIQIDSKLFNRVGFPIYIPAYAVFKNTVNNLEYVYESDKMLRVDSNKVIIPITEGVMKNNEFVSQALSTNDIVKFYISSKNIAENSFTVMVNNHNYMRVKSFIDNDGVNNNRQFMIKYSNDVKQPFILYVRGTEENDVVRVAYRETTGENGNLSYKSIFETDEFLDNKSEQISFSEEEILITNISGFNYGSDGSDINSLKSAIGFNHGVNLLFDKVSYENFINKYSTLLLQKINLSEEYKAIKYIYLSKRVYLENTKSSDIINNYRNIIMFRKYLLSNEELKEFDNLLEESEYALSSHTLKNSDVIKYALQITIFGINSQVEVSNHKTNISKLIYGEFAKFLYDKYHIVNIELLLNDYMLKHNIKLDYMIFDSEKNIDITTNIHHKDKLPILKGDFIITDSDNKNVQLFDDINFVIK